METLITKGIKISVETRYQSEYSKPIVNKYLFTYRITIENLGEKTVQLLRRHWFIANSMGHSREVEGEGVVGKQPVLLPGQSHQYVSWCPLTSSMGKMSGYFQMQGQEAGDRFQVQIPEFKLIASFKLN